MIQGTTGFPATTRKRSLNYTSVKYHIKKDKLISFETKQNLG